MLRLLADLVAVVHACLVAFVVLGQAAIILGLLRGWEWVRRFWFRVAHLLLIVIVAGQAWLGIPCVLTVWENALRRHAGQDPYSTGFIERWVHRLIFVEAPAWVFTMTYTLFALAVLATFIFGPPRWPRSASPSRRT
jgi:hypothetical protein